MNLSFCEIEQVKFFFVSASITNILNKVTFQAALIRWYNDHKRDLPWRKFTDPYIIWISEVILQQTRVNQGLSYFQKFHKNYPTVKDLALAPESQVLKDWEGLGYYSRARNMHFAAKQIFENFEGKFPKTHAEILDLKGVGTYTAAAISSFAYNEPHAVVDGNVFRVLSRFFGVSTPINITRGKKEFEKLAAEMLDQKDPATYNQAIMEFGALQCVPKNPECGACPLQSSCYAFLHEKVESLPAKEKKKYDRQRYFHFLMVSYENKILVEQREEKDIWQKLHQFPLVEGAGLYTFEEVLEEWEGKANHWKEIALKRTIDLKPHKLSHQTIHCRIFEMEIAGAEAERVENKSFWVQKDELEALAFPRPLRLYLDRKQLTLPLDN